MSGTKEKKQNWVDDGRVIANMNVDGVPGSIFRPVKRRRFDEFGQNAAKREPVELTRTERKAISGGVVAAYISMILGVVVLFVLIMLFLSKVWLAS